MSAYLTIPGADFLLSLMANHELAPESFYVALIRSVAPGLTTEGDELDEPVDDSYARAELKNEGDVWAVSNGVLSLNEEVGFPLAVSDWGEIQYWALCDAPTGGRVLWSGEMEALVFVGEGDQHSIPPGGLTLDFDMFGWS